MKKKTILTSAYVFFLVLAIGIGVFLTQKKQDIRERASEDAVEETAGGNVILSLNPSKISVARNDTFTVGVLINNTASNYHISAADVTVTYPTNQLILTQIDVDSASFFGRSYTVNTTEMLALGIHCDLPTDCPFKILNNNQPARAYCVSNMCSNTNSAFWTPGQARFVLGAPCRTTAPWTCYPQTGQGALAKLRFTVKSNAPAGNAVISFKTGAQQIAATEFANPLTYPNPVNVVNTSQLISKTIQIIGPSVSPTPSPSPTVRPTPTPTASPSPSPSPSVSPTPQASPSPTPSVSPSPSPSVSPSPVVSPSPSVSPSPGAASLNFKIKFQGIASQKADKQVRVTLKNGPVFENVSVVSDANGVYSGTVTNIPAGTYEVLIKGPVHLQKNMGSVAFSENQVADKDWSDTELKVGDFDNNNELDIEDVTAILVKFTALSVPITDSIRLFDVDDNNFLDIDDITTVLVNYTALVVPGDN